MRQQFYIFICFVAFLFISMRAMGQIKGIVTDSVTNEPLMYVTVQYAGKGVGDITDVNGAYQVVTHKGWDELTFSSGSSHTVTS